MPTGNSLEALVGARLIQRCAGGAAFFNRTLGILRFALTVMCATAIAATVGVATLTTAGLAPVDDAVSIWLTWWLGDAVGAVVVTPLLLLWKSPIDFAVCARRAVDLLALAFSVIVVSWGLRVRAERHVSAEVLSDSATGSDDRHRPRHHGAPGGRGGSRRTHSRTGGAA